MIGLTGGIGSGKSTVASLLAERGAEVIDADRVAHEVYDPGTAGHEELIERFGRDILDGDGRIDRKLLGAMVFNDQAALEDLNRIIHPKVRQEVARRLLQVSESNPEAVVVLEAALMTETGWSGGAGTLWTVIADPQIVVERLMKYRGMQPEDIRLRLSAQASNEERRKIASVVIENNGTLAELEEAVDQVWNAHLASLDEA